MTAEERSKYIDLDSGLQRVRGNKTLFKRMLGLFTASEEFDAFEKALAENDLAHAGEVAHAIKGMTGNLSMVAIFDLSTQLMVQLRQGIADEQLIADYRDALNKTKICVDELMQEM